MARENPTWGAPRVQSVLRLLGADRVIVFGEEHLLSILRSYMVYYNESPCHLSLDRNSPIPREVKSPPNGKIVAIPQVGGQHHRYARAA